MANDAENVQSAYTAATNGDIEPLVTLFDPDIDWRGVRRGALWWRSSPG
jgi:ketosteroid isomerase-like protein